jgi:hypothetical protein
MAKPVTIMLALKSKKGVLNKPSACGDRSRFYFFTPRMASLAALATRNFTTFLALFVRPLKF